jgi:D-alanyl-D-alanine carboxypeptidase
VLIARILGLSLLISTAAAAEPRALDDATVAEVQTRLDKAISEHALPGATAAIVTDDGQRVSFSAGFADKDIGRAMSPETRMMSGSIGKMFAAAVAVSLVKDGVLELDAPISKWLGETSEYSALPNYRKITVRMLLNHSSGLVDHVYLDSFWDAARARIKESDFAFTPPEMIAFGYGSKPLFEPGEGFHYTDLGYLLLGLVIEKAGGKSYYTLLQERFLYPLGLTFTGPSDGRIFNGLAQGYLAGANPLLGDAGTVLADGVFRINTRSEWTGGGLVTNAGDLAEWAWDVFEGRTRLGTEYARMMVSKPVEAGKRGRYGFGVYVFDTEFGPLYAHGGWFMGYKSYVGYFPNCRVSASIQINSEQIGDKTGVVFRDVFVPALKARGCAPKTERN